jgi:ParB family chromosome partitioning protein
VNVRTETAADKDFVASIKDLGVLQPIRAVRTTDGALRVETGHRRTLAAIEAGLATVPVLVIADERTDDAGTVERIVRQYAENEHRTGLTTVDRLGVVEQLSLLNVSAAQIAKRTRMKRPEVDQALMVTRSDLAKAASVRYDLTLDQAAAVAEFEDDTETVKALVAAAKSGQFDHVLERARQERDDTRARAQAETDLAATGVRVIAAPAWGDAAKPLGWNVRDAGCTPGPDSCIANRASRAGTGTAAIPADAPTAGCSRPARCRWTVRRS